MTNSLIRIKKVEAKTGLKKSMHYDLIKKGLMPSAIRIGDRARAWISSEIDAVVAARIAGKSDDEIREMIKALMAKRQQTANEILSTT